MEYEEKIKRDLFWVGHPITCEKCSHQFNIFDVWRHIATTIKEAQDVIEESSDYIFSQYEIVGGTGKENEKVKKFMAKNMTDIFLKEIINDCLMWGTCFIKHKKINDEINLEIIDPCDCKITTEHKMSSGGSGAYLGEQVKTMTNYKTGEVIPKSDIILLQASLGPGINTDLGHSVLGGWFTTWLNIDLSKRALMIMSPQDPNYTATKKMLQNLIEGTQHQHLQSLDNGRNSRHRLSSSIEREIFSLIIPKEKTTLSERMQDDYVGTPQIEFLKDIPK
jgi:hypothetical protein